jgi:glycerate kinase
MTRSELEQGLDNAVHAFNRVAEAITPNAAPGPGAAGGVVASLTEAVMDVAAALCKIADSVDNLAEAVREIKDVE